MTSQQELQVGAPRAAAITPAAGAQTTPLRGRQILDSALADGVPAAESAEQRLKLAQAETRFGPAQTRPAPTQTQPPQGRPGAAPQQGPQRPALTPQQGGRLGPQAGRDATKRDFTIIIGNGQYIPGYPYPTYPVPGYPVPGYPVPGYPIPGPQRPPYGPTYHRCNWFEGIFNRSVVGPSGQRWCRDDRPYQYGPASTPYPW